MHYPLIIIGGGTAAIAAIAEALELGVESVAYIEQRRAIGGECAINGCVPAHIMLAGANAFHEMKHAAQYGVEASGLQMRFGMLMDKVEQVVSSGLSDPFAEDERVTLYQGHAAFSSPNMLRINPVELGPDPVTISGDQILIATGAQPVIPHIDGLQDTGYWLYPQATHAEELPQSLAIIGGGRIGIEFAQLFQRLGTQVTLFETQDRLLFREDADASIAMLQMLESEGVTVHLSAEVIRAERVEAPNRHPLKRLTFLDAGREMHTLDAAEILVTAGRIGCPHDLNLTAAGLQPENGCIVVDDRCRTSVEHIWAVGDAAGPYRFTHAADYQAVIAVQNALRFRDVRVNYSDMPLAYYTDPPFARVGMTEAKARETFQTVIVLQRSLESVTRFRLEGETQGFCKIIVDGDTDNILGAHIMAAHADDCIHLVSLAMHAGITVPQMAQMVYAYPTRAQIVQKTLELYRKARTEVRSVAFGVLHTSAAE